MYKRQLVNSIKYHHGTDSKEHSPLTLAIYAANQAAHYLELTKQAQLDNSPTLLVEANNIDNNLPAEVKKWLGWPLSDVSKWLSNLDDEIDKALAFVDLSDGD